jgi:uracil-DNA glycosylase family 4
MSKIDKLLSDFDDEPLSAVSVSERPKPKWERGNAVPNLMPRIGNSRIAIIGEAPGKDEELQNTPFVGASGRFLTSLLSKANIVRDSCFIGNICQYRPPNNDITFFSRDGDEIKEGLENLTSSLSSFDPNICLLLGKTALWAAKGVDGISDWRGSLFIGDRPGPFFGRKCIASFHPAACLRQYEWTPLLMFDIKRAKEESLTSQLVLPQRDIRIDLSADELVDELDRIERDGLTISPDIEGGLYGISCISLATSANYAVVVPFINLDGSDYWKNPDDEFCVFRALVKVMASYRVRKIWQNGLYDRFVKQYGFSIFVANSFDDTMLKFWEWQCELEKGLGPQNSILNREPYYKFERKTTSRETFYMYCGKDGCTTFENNTTLERLLPPLSRQHYRFNVALLNPLLYMEIRGIKYDTALAKQKLSEVSDHIYRLQRELDVLSGFTNCPKTLSDVQAVMCYKRDPSTPKKQFADDYKWIARRMNGNSLSDAEVARLSIACGTSMNIKSPMFKTYLYETLKLPKQYKTDPKTGIERLSTDYEALLKIKKKSPHRAIDVAIELGELRTRSQMLSIHSDGDGRIRCGYNAVGTETGRLNCYTSPTGSGYNLQTIPAESSLKPLGHPLRSGMRDLFVADEGYYLFQCDLSGADGWTVAAHLAALGDRTMLDDYRAGIKPAKVLCYLLRHGATSLERKTREEIKALTKSIEKDSWDYFACKIGQHGTCYLMGPQKLANQIFLQSEGNFNITKHEAEDLQKLFMVRYNVRRWHRWMENIITAARGAAPRLTSASGHTRKFLGRTAEVLGEMLAHEPQSNTTYATNLAALRLWTDPENRLPAYANEILRSERNIETEPSTSDRFHRRAHLRIEPLHQVHDALIGQFPIVDTAWAVGKIKSWFNNKLIIAGQEIVIPFEGAYGTNWALDEKSKVGSI